MLLASHFRQFIQNIRTKCNVVYPLLDCQTDKYHLHNKFETILDLYCLYFFIPNYQSHSALQEPN